VEPSILRRCSRKKKESEEAPGSVARGQIKAAEERKGRTKKCEREDWLLWWRRKTVERASVAKDKGRNRLQLSLHRIQLGARAHGVLDDGTTTPVRVKLSNSSPVTSHPSNGPSFRRSDAFACR